MEGSTLCVCMCAVGGVLRAVLWQWLWGSHILVLQYGNFVYCEYCNKYCTFVYHVTSPLSKYQSSRLLCAYCNGVKWCVTRAQICWFKLCMVVHTCTMCISSWILKGMEGQLEKGCYIVVVHCWEVLVKWGSTVRTYSEEYKIKWHHLLWWVKTVDVAR